MSSRTSPIGQPITIRRAVARDAKRLTRLVRGSGAYEGKYAAAVAGYRVGPDYLEAHRAFVAVGADEHGGRVLGFYWSSLHRSSTCCSSPTKRKDGVLGRCSSRTCSPRPVPPGSTVLTVEVALSVMAAARTGQLVVCDEDGMCTGLVTRDRLTAVRDGSGYTDRIRLRDIADLIGPFASPLVTRAEGERAMRCRRLGAPPVVDGHGNALGVLALSH